MKTFKDLISNKISVPSYQRAFAWSEKQIEQYISDMLEINNSKNNEYYLGHYILEQKYGSGNFEVIDGQQRITTFILFLLACRLVDSDKDKDFYKYTDNFQTVDYDNESFNKLKDIVDESKIKNKEINNLVLEEHNNTLSAKRMISALETFYKMFKENGILNKNKIDSYIITLLNAQISTHITNTKSVAVQIFELQNTRGIQLSLIEKFKSYLMKSLYLYSDTTEVEIQINEIQKSFATIYAMEESAQANTFRGNMTLDDILFHHLRIVNDGNKLKSQNNDHNIYYYPSSGVNRENAVLEYIKKQIDESNSSGKRVSYIKNLVKTFEKSVVFLSKTIIDFDNNHPLIGDTLILDKFNSIEFILLLHHKGFDEIFNDEIIFRQWEKLLYLRDFHYLYYRKVYKDNFPILYLNISNIDTLNNLSKTIESILSNYLKTGFNISDKLDDKTLIEIVKNLTLENEENILKNAYYWWTEKMVYILYKYELSIGAERFGLRNIMKSGRSIEHILPQQWNTGDIEDENFKKQVNEYINGIGNLILITASENSSLSNKNPSDKNYQNYNGGTYTALNEKKIDWSKKEKWISNIENRGKKIYEFLVNFIDETNNLISK